MIRRIMLDLDDVCNSFTMHVLGHVYGCEVGSYDYDRFPVECGYGILAAREVLSPHLPRLSKSEFWDSITRDVWRTLPPSRELNWLLGHCEELVGKENVCLLTAPTIDPESLAGKLEWIHSNLPSWLHRQFLIGPVKHFCARPDTLLIDDRDENCRLFAEHGGQSLLVPRPWNKLAHVNTQDYLCRFFNQVLEVS